MNNPRRIIIKREELYERIWQTPAKKLAKEYELSDARLTVICRLLKVPKPAPGYWAKVKHGKSPRRPPLPAIGAGEKSEFVHIVNEVRLPPILVDPDIQALIEKVPDIRVQARLTNPDPLVRNARVWLGRRPYMYSELPRAPHLSLNVYPDSKSRSMRLMDALVKGIKKLGYDVQGEDASNRDQYFEILGQRTRFQLKERAKQIDHVLTKEEQAEIARGWTPFTHKFDYLPTGHLELILSPETWPRAAFKRTWADSTRKPLENQLRDVVQGLILLAGGQKREEARKKRAEQEAAGQRELREEAERRQAEEEAQKRALDVHIQNWAKSKQLKSFVQEFEERLMSGPYSEQDKQGWRPWIRWAREYASQLDPINATLAKFADPAQKNG